MSRVRFIALRSAGEGCRSRPCRLGWPSLKPVRRPATGRLRPSRKGLGKALALAIEHADRTLTVEEARRLLAASTAERDLMRTAAAWFGQAIEPPVKILHPPNERILSHLDPEARRLVLFALKADNVDFGCLDWHVGWDARKGASGNLGHCWIEFKRPDGTGRPRPGQIRFAAEMRAMGVVAGFAASLVDAQALLIEAGAPLRFRLADG
jgi:hypothetical protein